MSRETGGAVDVGRLIDGRPLSRAQRLVIAVCLATMFLDGYDIQVMALAVPTLAASWALPPSSFGLALSAVIVGLTLGSGLLGPLADRYGRRTLLVATLAAAASPRRSPRRPRRRRSSSAGACSRASPSAPGCPPARR
ncbi:MAG: hypothetical protein U1F06_06090 [Steroidobacteraceae bacterium]